MKPSWGKVRIGAIVTLAVVAFAILAATAGVSHAQLATSPWPMAGHDPAHTGLSTVDTSANNGIVKWALQISSSIIYSSPAIGADGTIYIGSTDGNLYAVNPVGTPKWSFPTGGSVEGDPAIAADGTVYVSSYEPVSNIGILYALTDGGQNTVTQKWAFSQYANAMGSPVIGADGTIYVLSTDGNLYAINPSSGIQKWAFRNSGPIQYSPAIGGADGTIYVGCSFFCAPPPYIRNPYCTDVDAFLAVGLCAVNSEGTLNWAFIIGQDVFDLQPSYAVSYPPAVGADGTIYFASTDSLYASSGGSFTLNAVNPNGSGKWAFTTGGVPETSPAIGADDTIYVGVSSVPPNGDGILYAVYDNNANPLLNGTQKWAFTTNGELILWSLAIGGDGTIYLPPYALNPSGTQKWVSAVAGYGPAIGADGTIYVGGGDGNLYAIGPHPPTTISVPASLAMGNSPVSDTVTKNLTIKNTGHKPLFIGSVTSNNPTEFAATGATTCPPPPGGLAPGLSCTITIGFTPNAVGARSATLSVYDNTATGSQDVALSGTGTADMTVTPASFAIGDVKDGSKLVKAVVVHNFQTTSVSLGEGFSGPNAGDFSITGGTCTSTLAAKAACSLLVTFAPTAVGTESATLTVTDSPDTLGPYSVSFTASATVPESLSATKLVFGNVYQTASKALNITVNNHASSGPITLTGTTIGGANAGDFSVTGGSCGGSLAALSSCTYAVTFTPTTEGAESSTLSIAVTEDPNGGPPAVALSGTGLTPLKALPLTGIAFGTIASGHSSANKTVTVYNYGGAAVSLSEGITGTNFADFAVTGGTCSGTLAGGGAHCTYLLKFTPSIVGAESATLGVSAVGDTASPHNVSLSGTGS